MKTILLGILMVFLSCKGQKKAAMDNSANTDESLTLLLQDHYSGSDVPETLVIKDEKSLRIFYAKINRTRKPGLPVPEVDFSKEMVLIFCSGKQKDGTFPRLFVIKETDKEMVFDASQGKNQEKANSSADTSPFCVYKMPLTQKEITFKFGE